MANSIEWGHAGIKPVLLNNDAVREAVRDFDEDDVAGDWALTIGTDSAMLLYGKPTEIHDWLRIALALIAEPARKQRNQEIKARRKEAGAGKCPHSWLLVEDEYSRSWGTHVDEENKTIRATSGGWSDYSEEGTGSYLICTNCDHEKPVPEDWEVDYR